MKINKKMRVVLALVISIILWGYVFGQTNSTIKTTIKDVPITILNSEYLSNSNLAISNMDYSSINITFSGQRSNTSKMTVDDFKVTCDVLDLEEGVQTIRLRVTAPEDIVISTVSTQTVKVTIEKATSAEKKIDVIVVNDKNDKTEPYIVQTSLSSTKIYGAESLVNSTIKLVAYLDASKVTDDMQAFNTSLVAVDENGDEIDRLTFSDTNVSVTAKIVNKKTVPLKINVTGEESSRFTRTISYPSAVTIKGSDINLESVTEIWANDIDISSIYSSCNIMLDFDLPSGIELASDSVNSKAVVTVKGAGTKTFTFTETDITCNNVETGRTVTIESADIDITIFGPNNVIDEIEKEDITLSIDASGCYLGGFSLPINVECKTSPDIITLSQDNVWVVVKR